MDSKYKTQIEDSHIERKLLRVDNLSILEELLNRDSQRLEKLQKLKKDNKLDIGKKITTKELKELFPKICTEVDDFLGIQSKGIPKFGYFNLFDLKSASRMNLIEYTSSILQIAIAETLFMIKSDAYITNFLFSLVGGKGVYNFLKAKESHSKMKNGTYYIELYKEILLEKIQRIRLIPVAGHEYAHHIQHSGGLRDDKYLVFREGHARGVQRHLSEDYREREDNEAFLYKILDSNVGEFKSAYVWICEQLGKSIRSSLLKTKTNRDSAELNNLYTKGKPTPHAIGNSLFSIYEALYGKQIYNHLIHGNFKFS